MVQVPSADGSGPISGWASIIYFSSSAVGSLMGQTHRLIGKIGRWFTTYTPIYLSRLSTYGKDRLVLFRTSLGSFRENDLIGSELVCVKRRFGEPFAPTSAL